MAVGEIAVAGQPRSPIAPPAMRLLPPRAPALLCVLALMSVANSAAAQTEADVVRGRVTDDSSHAVVGATVMITRGPDRLTQQTTTDSSGAFSSRFEEGTGDYLVYVSATGFKSDRRRVQRQALERELVASFTLARDLTVLAAVKVTAVKPERASNTVR